MIDFDRLLAVLSSARVSFVIVGGVAATVHGSSRLTADLDIVYDRSLDNLQRLVAALQPLQPYLRGAPPGLPFRLDVETLERGLNFTLTSTAGPIDLLGELTGIGDYQTVNENAIDIPLFGGMHRCLTLDALIIAKRAAGRPRDFEAIAELEAIRDETEENLGP